MDLGYAEQTREGVAVLTIQLVLELGSYVGYSGISFGRVSPSPHSSSRCFTTSFMPGLGAGHKAYIQHIVDMHPDAVYPAHWSDDYTENRAGYVSLEKSDVYAATAQGAFNLAGLGNAMKVCPACSSSFVCFGSVGRGGVGQAQEWRSPYTGETSGLIPQTVTDSIDCRRQLDSQSSRSSQNPQHARPAQV